MRTSGAPEAPRARVRRGVPPALAWAASLILALGTGWAARGVLVPSAAVESEGAVLGRAVVATDADMPESNVEPAVLEVATASPEVRAEEPPRPTERARNEPAVAADRIEPAGQRLAEAEESAAGPPASPAPEEPSREAFADLSGEVLASRRDSAAAAAFRQDRQEADALVLAEAPQAGATEDNRARRADQPLFLPVGGGTIMIPGLEVRSVEFDSSLSAGGVLIVQVVPGGEVVELFYLRLADGSEVEARAEAQDREGLEIGWQDELPSGWSSVVLERDGGWLLARSPIPLEALNALLDALR